MHHWAHLSGGVAFLDKLQLMEGNLGFDQSLAVASFFTDEPPCTQFQPCGRVVLNVPDYDHTRMIGISQQKQSPSEADHSTDQNQTPQ
jgi:hypothetical protein